MNEMQALKLIAFIRDADKRCFSAYARAMLAGNRGKNRRARRRTGRRR